MKTKCRKSIDFIDDCILHRLCVITLLASCSLPAWTATQSSPLDVPIEGIEIRWGREMYELCSLLNRPCGQEDTVTREIDYRRRPTLKLQNTTPREILNTLTQRYPSHQWIIRDEVLTLEPKSRHGKDLLARKLAHISIHGSSSYKAALSVFEQAGIHVGQEMVGDPKFARLDLELQNVTVREALNAIAKADGQVLWIFRPIDSEKGTGSFGLSSWRKSGMRPYDDHLNLQ
jgi:hypothetical protein